MVVLPRAVRGYFLAQVRRERLVAPVYAAMVDNLFGTLVGFAILGVTAALLAGLTFAAKPCAATGSMLLAMLAVVFARTSLVIAYRRSSTGGVKETVGWEAMYAVLGIAMMLCIGSLCAFNAIENDGDLSLIVSVITEMGIAGCIAGRNGSRPRIVQQQLVAVFTPFGAALAYRRDVDALTVLLLIVLFGFATMSSTRSVYATLVAALNGGRRNLELSGRVRRVADQFDTALNNMTSGLLLFDSSRRLVVANERVKDLMGRDLVEGLVGRRIGEVAEAMYAAYGIGRLDAERIKRQFRKVREAKGEDKLRVCDHRRGRIFDMRLRAMADGGVVFNVDDVTEQRAKDAEIRHLAHNDALTGLPNRVSLARHLGRLLESFDDGRPVVVMYLDLDRFKEINDDLGHAAGDSVLVETTRRLKNMIRAGDFLSRIAGDEFVFVFSAVQDVAAIDKVASRVIAAISEPIDIGSRRVAIGASAGLCFARRGPGAAEEALRAADVALYDAKTKGRGQAVWFEPGMDERARTKREMIGELRTALETGRGLELHYQPVFDARTGAVIACEALTRWTHHVYGSVAPTIFVPLAEESGLICKLGRWSLMQACSQAVGWKSEIKIAVNVSGLQFQERCVADVVAEVLKATGLPAERLEIEITESVLAANLETMTNELEWLAETGVSIALDDFGTGFSSLSLLHRLPLNKVKMDRSFVARLDRDPASLNFIASVIQMLMSLRKQVVIEGVETAEQLAAVESAQGRFIQGFYFARPMRPDALRPFVQPSTLVSGSRQAG